MIPIQNVYYMLSYAFQALSEQGYKDVATEHFDNTNTNELDLSTYLHNIYTIDKSSILIFENGTDQLQLDVGDIVEIYFMEERYRMFYKSSWHIISEINLAFLETQGFISKISCVTSKELQDKVRSFLQWVNSNTTPEAFTTFLKDNILKRTIISAKEIEATEVLKTVLKKLNSAQRIYNNIPKNHMEQNNLNRLNEMSEIIKTFLQSN